MDDSNNELSYEEKFKNQKELLENQYKFPCEYLFKFIVPKGKENEVRALFPKVEPKLRPSKNGNYISLTFGFHCHSSDLVLAIYEKASTIEGLIAL